jgi:tetratricopeptide (TPR) repeat protein
LAIALKNRDAARRRMALAAFEKALSLDPDLAPALNGRGAVFKSMGWIKEAVADWLKAAGKPSPPADVFINLAVAYIETGQKPEARKYLELYRDRFAGKLAPEEKSRLERLLRETK